MLNNSWFDSFKNLINRNTVKNTSRLRGKGRKLSKAPELVEARIMLSNAPINVVPGAKTFDEDVSTAFSGLSVTDPDDNLATTQLTVSNGKLTVTLDGGALITGGANGSSTLTLSGNQAQINAALSTVSYVGNQNFSGSDLLTMLRTGASITGGSRYNIVSSEKSGEQNPINRKQEAKDGVRTSGAIHTGN